MSEPAVMERVLSMYSALPPQFRETPPMTGDTNRDLFGFQSANIQATLQLLRMVLLSAEEVGVDRKCDVAGELLSVFSKVPVDYLTAISSPLVRKFSFHALRFCNADCSIAAPPGWNWVHPWLGYGRYLIRRILPTSPHLAVSTLLQWPVAHPLNL